MLPHFASGRARRSFLLTPTLLLPLLFVLSLPAVTTRFYASDELQFFAWLRSWSFDRDVNFENEYQHFYDTGTGTVQSRALFHETFLERTNTAGRRENFTPIGCAILWAPFYAAGHGVAVLTGAPRDGFSLPYVAAVTYASAFYGLCALLLTTSLIGRVVGRGTWATFAVWLGTPLAFYMYVAPGFGHACSAFAVSLCLWTWLRVRERWTTGGVVLLGLSSALMFMVRDQDVLFAAGPALDFLKWTATVRLTAPRVAHVAARAGAGLGAFAIGYAPQIWAYQSLNGHPGQSAVVTRKLTWTAPHFFEVLFSPGHGLFLWTPLALVAVCGLLWLAFGREPRTAADARWLGLLAVAMFLLQVYANGSIESWTVAGGFGQRRFIAATPLFALGLAALAPSLRSAASRPARAALVGIVLICVWWNVGLMAQFGLHTMDRQALSLGENARMTFVELPLRAPSLVWRYFTDRASFYGLPKQ